MVNGTPAWTYGGILSVVLSLWTAANRKLADASREVAAATLRRIGHQMSTYHIQRMMRSI
jgi:hypothetical protein